MFSTFFVNNQSPFKEIVGWLVPFTYIGVGVCMILLSLFRTGYNVSTVLNVNIESCW